MPAAVIDEVEEETPVVPAPPVSASFHAASNSTIAAIAAIDEFHRLSGHLLNQMIAFRRYEASRRTDTVGGAAERARQIEHLMSANSPYISTSEVRELQAELSRLATVNHVTENEVRRSLRARAERVHEQFKAWADFALFFAGKVLAERRRRVADFAGQFGMAPFPTPITAETEEFIRTLTGFVEAARDEVLAIPRLTNRRDVELLGAMPTFISVPNPPMAPGISPAISALQYLGVDTSEVFAAGQQFN